jgi:hypothetical protein
MNARIRCRPGTVAVLAVLAGGLVGCGGSSGQPAATSAAPGPTPSGALNEQITGLYQTFFDGTLPAQTKVAILERGPEFVQVLRQQAAGPLAKSSGVKVTRVVRSTDNSAAVTFNVLLDGKPVLADQHGGAVLDGGRWKVSASTYCALLSVQQLTAPPCKGA